LYDETPLVFPDGRGGRSPPPANELANLVNAVFTFGVTKERSQMSVWAITGYAAAPMTNSPYSKYAPRFLLVGLLMTYGLMFLMTARGPFAGLGDGAGHFDTPPTEGLVLPYSAYFVCGLVAACSAKRWIRIVAAIVAHLTPFITFVFTGHHDVAAFVAIDLVTFVAFGFAWFQMLKKEPHGV
jgi:hypothetical protein